MAGSSLTVGDVLERAGRHYFAQEYGEALQLASAVARQQPGNGPAWLMVALCLRAQRVDAEAETAAQQAARCLPRSAKPLVLLANAALQRGDAAAAVALAEDALRREPGDFDALLVLGTARRDAGQPLEVVLATYDEAERRGRNRTAKAIARYNRSLELLRLGRWGRGWQDFEQRWRVPAFLADHALAEAGRRWRGDAMRPGATLLLWGEQGAGDQIMALRWVPVVRDRLPGVRVVLRVSDPLVDLVAHQFPDLEVVGNAAPVPAHDRHCPLLSLPLACGTVDPWGVPHLTLTAPGPPARGPGLRVGFVWAGARGNDMDRRRSTTIAEWVPVLATPGVEWVSLLVGDRADEAAPVFAAGLATDCRPRVTTFGDLATVIAGCDLVVGVDTGPLHLASALGVPTWWLIAANPDWRWLTPDLAPERTGWYPSARLWRQRWGEPWAAVLHRVASALPAALALPEAA